MAHTYSVVSIKAPHTTHTDFYYPKRHAITELFTEEKLRDWDKETEVKDQKDWDSDRDREAGAGIRKTERGQAIRMRERIS